MSVCGTLEHLYLISNDTLPLLRTVTWHTMQNHSILNLFLTPAVLYESLGSLTFSFSFFCDVIL